MSSTPPTCTAAASQKRWSARPSPAAATTLCWPRRQACQWATNATIVAVRAAGWSPSWTTACAVWPSSYIDLYQIHRWDPSTSDDETLSALTDLQRAGKIRYFGSSTFPAYRIVQAEWAARANNLSRYVTEQPSYSILQRGIETHVLPVTEQYGLGVLAWSPLASGWLSGAIRAGQEITTSRSALMPQRFDIASPANRARLDAVEQLAKVADQAGLTMIQLALGFVTAHPAVTSAIVGPRTLDHLRSQLAAADTVLSADVLDAIDAIVAPGVDLAAHEKLDTPPALLDAAKRRR